LLVFPGKLPVPRPCCYTDHLQRPFHHVPAVLFFVAVAIVWSFPLAAHLGTHIPGEGTGDNVAFLWNFWWMREALSRPDVAFFHTDRLFAPYGIDLTLYTHTALPALIGATLLGRLSPIAAQNVLIIAALALNGIAAYWLAYSRARDRGAALVAGLLFAGSPYISTHLLGHFNLIGAWGLPLFLLAFEQARERWSIRSAVVCALVLVAIAYTDYYYLVYCVALACGLILWDLRPLRLTITSRPLSPSSGRVLLSLALLDALIVAAIVLTGGFDTTIAGIRIRADRVTNPLTFGWILLVAAALLRYRPSVTRGSIDRVTVWREARLWIPAALIVAIGMLPLLIGAWSLWQSGTYVAPRRSFRSGPGGIDLATLLLGNPQHPWSGGWTRAVYARLGLDRMEVVSWIGVAPMALTVWVFAAHRRDRQVRRWLAIAAAFFVWSLGPWLRVAGVNTGLLLPQNFFSLVPVLSNARMPGRASSVVFLALGIAIAVALSHLPERRRRLVVVTALLLIAVDFLPAPFPLTAMEAPAFFAELRERRDGTIVCELPVGARDGFGALGRFDDQALLDATVHEHPIVGGSTSRLPDVIADGYRSMPVVRSLFRLSGGAGVDPADAALSREAAAAALRDANIGYLVLNRATASPALVSYVETNIPLVLLQSEGARDLYSVMQ
jgi:hypothetical protein